MLNLLSKDGELVLYPQALCLAAADRLFKTLLHRTAWQEQSAKIMGRDMKIPRLTAWHGEKAYGYSGIRHDPLPWTPDLMEIKTVMETLAGCRFNSVLLNLYRDGRDSVSWHADDEKVLGLEPTIASVSLGSERVFQLRHRVDRQRKLSITLPHGSCLVMAKGLQAGWLHQLPKTARPVGPRINLTFRTVF